MAIGKEFQLIILDEIPKFPYCHWDGSSPDIGNIASCTSTNVRLCGRGSKGSSWHLGRRENIPYILNAGLTDVVRKKFECL